jgi:hypothetical protein
MYTLYEIAQHVITEQPYTKKEQQQIGYQESRAYKLLEEAATLEILEKVRCFVKGSLSGDLIGQGINNENAYRYLAAAKVVDMDTPSSEMSKSTYKIREMALLCSKPEKDGRSEINMLNAFSMPSLIKDDVDLLLINELDISHPIVKKAAFGNERNIILSKIYTYCQKEALIIPEMVPVIEAVVRERFKAMTLVSDSLPIDTTIVYKGSSGAGKSFAIREFTKSKSENISSEIVVQSTDNIKNDIRTRTNKVFNMAQVHLLGFSTFKMLTEVMKEKGLKLSTIQEGWINSVPAVDTLFKDLKNSNQKLVMHDFDGSYEALCLRVLSRYKDDNAPKLPLDWVERGFKTSRESRGYLLQQLRDVDNYQFTFVESNGEVVRDKDPRSVVSDPTEIDKDMELTKKIIINQEHTTTFGDSLNAFIGMTIEEAFEKVIGI